MKPEGSLPHSQMPTTFPYPEPAGSTSFHVPFSLLRSYQMLRSYQSINPGWRQVFMIRSKTSFHGDELSTSRPTPKLEDHTLSAVRDWLFNIFAATFHIGDRSSICNMKTRHVPKQSDLQWTLWLQNSASGVIRGECSITVTRRITTFRLTTDHIYDGGP
jgi:hypothetical protein